MDGIAGGKRIGDQVHITTEREDPSTGGPVQWREFVADDHWNDWRWHERNAVHSVAGLREALDIPAAFIELALGRGRDPYFFMKITPHFLSHMRSLAKRFGPERIVPLLRSFLPTQEEDETKTFYQIDGMGEDGTGEHELISRLYEDRGLLFVTNRCPVHCRYCFRRRKINDDEHIVSTDEVFWAIQRIRNNPKIRDVIISGGDPLSLADHRLDEILEMVYSIDHVAIVRIDTKFASVLPQRFTPNLLEVLSKRKPLYMTLHFTHADELSSETQEVCNELADRGVVLGSYIPLLKGVNDDRETLKELFLSLAKNRVRPYYLVQNVTNKWNKHFQVPVERGLELMDGLHGEISGVGLPTYVVYLPNAGGKVPLQNNYITKRTKEGFFIKNFQGREIFYWDPQDGQ